MKSSQCPPQSPQQFILYRFNLLQLRQRQGSLVDFHIAAVILRNHTRSREWWDWSLCLRCASCVQDSDTKPLICRCQRSLANARCLLSLLRQVGVAVLSKGHLGDKVHEEEEQHLEEDGHVPRQTQGSSRSQLCKPDYLVILSNVEVDQHPGLVTLPGQQIRETSARRLRLRSGSRWGDGWRYRPRVGRHVNPLRLEAQWGTLVTAGVTPSRNLILYIYIYIYICYMNIISLKSLKILFFGSSWMCMIFNWMMRWLKPMPWHQPSEVHGRK